jgi:acetyltransferase-like isoleucine patch superfamily enzyme
MFRKIYLSGFGIFVSIVLNIVGKFHKPIMIYGFYCVKTKSFKKHTRISSSAKLVNKPNLILHDHVWIGHYCLIDSIGGVEISEGVNISSHSAIYSHSSHDALRLLGRDFIKIEASKRPGYILKHVFIGAYTFIGTSSVILPGVRIGKGCIIGAGSVVTHDIPDYAIAVGNPARVIGDTRERDKNLYPEYLSKDSYFENIEKFGI